MAARRRAYPPAPGGLRRVASEFVRLGEEAEREGRLYIAGLHFRSAEFFMLESDARKQPTRLRLLRHLREPFEGTYSNSH